MSLQSSTPSKSITDLIDLDAYFQRIGYEGDRSPTLKTLTAIHQFHTSAIAFENLTPLLKQPVRLDLPSLQQKLIQAGRGGYCFEQNLLFRAVLLALGFSVTCLAARVLWGVPQGVITPRSHMVLLVTLDGERHLADVGFGGNTLTTPIRLIPDAAQPTSHEPYRLKVVDNAYHLQALINQTWQPLYRFDLQEQFIPDYEVSNWYVSTHPNSLFVNSLIVARPDDGCRYSLRNNQFTIHDLNGLTERRTLTTATELSTVLEDRFRLTLPTTPELEQVLQHFTKG
jgi:N-hydroxyarylamine O-acetyltransferase